MMDPNMTRRARAEQKKKIKAAQRKLESGWKPGRSKRRKQKAAVMIQRVYRSHLLRQAFQRSRHNVRFTFTSLQAFGHARSRQHWRNVDLRRLSREELRLLALTLNLPSTGKKVLLICRIQRWMDLHVLGSDMAAQAAARALENRRKAQGSVYFCEAHPGADLVDIRPLRGHHITSIAAGSESNAVYALDGARGAAWLCRTGGLASQVGLCSHVHRRDEFEPTPRESHWLATPVFLHTLRAEHVDRVYVARGHAMALAKAGELFSWGDNAHGALGFPAESAAQVARNRATVVGTLSNYQAVAATVGGHHSIAVCDHVAGHDGVVFCWGSNSHGQLGFSSSSSNTPADGPAKTSPTTFPRPAVMHQVAALRSVSVRQVACGGLHSLALTTDGKVYSWGCSDGGRLGQGRVPKRTSDVSEPALVRGKLSNLVALTIACGAWHSACIAAEASQVVSGVGRVMTWGTGIYGQLGVGKAQVTYEPQPVRLPPREMDDEVFAIRLACGTHHTAALTVDNRIFTWGSTRAFNGVPTELRLSGGERFGRVVSLACGRTFTVFNTVSRDAASYEWPEVPRLWRDKPAIIPHLDLSKVPTLPLCTSNPLPPFSKATKVVKTSSELPSPVRLEPFADRRAREEEEVREAKRIDDIDIETIVHPLCRLCWRCDGFQPSPLRLWMCRNCSHERQLHGVRRPGVPMGEYEAVRKLQCLFRARRARRVLQRAREQRYQRIFSISHNEFFYYNVWQGKKSWARPAEISEDFDVPIRDPDASPRISPPLTPVEAATKLQAAWRGLQARRLTLSLLRDRYEKHFDLEKERVYHVRKSVGKKEPSTKLWDPPPLLRKRYDLGDPVEIQRLAKFASMTHDEAARIVQHAYRCYRGREFMRRILRSRIKKLWDATTGRFYYYNATTKESAWEKPRLLLNDDDDDNFGSKGGRHHEPTQGRRRAVALRPEKFHNEEAAARTIQALYRRFATRKTLLQLISRRYRKMMDPVSGQPYYYDSVSGTATWFKPAVFGAYDLELFDDSTVSASGRRQSTLVAPQSSALYAASKLPRISERARLKRHKRRLQRLRQMSRDEAASRLQRMWRTHRAKDELRELLFDAYEKIYDPTTEHFYYYNRKTGIAKWEKPALLVGDGRDIKETKVIKRRRSHTVTAPYEAKQVLFMFMRCSVARLELHRLLRERIQKVFDPNSQQYYYFDKLTGQSSWKKPVTLKGYDLSPV
ncbi:hypothetical protein PC121_g13644 [Phytophthora cactorum]|nr:hypothetical protein PC120_g11980 [Phytophthora cactorum]KAG3060132.1 hypothetical protein PC121_g13644 [Phytophthora cactorum]KAG4052857.1 hypothetical protein PC123_g11976 [Phytophthora cactorum]